MLHRKSQTGSDVPSYMPLTSWMLVGAELLTHLSIVYGSICSDKTERDQSRSGSKSTLFGSAESDCRSFGNTQGGVERIPLNRAERGSLSEGPLDLALLLLLAKGSRARFQCSCYVCPAQTGTPGSRLRLPNFTPLEIAHAMLSGGSWVCRTEELIQDRPTHSCTQGLQSSEADPGLRGGGPTPEETLPCKGHVQPDLSPRRFHIA